MSATVSMVMSRVDRGDRLVWGKDRLDPDASVRARVKACWLCGDSYDGGYRYLGEEFCTRCYVRVSDAGPDGNHVRDHEPVAEAEGSVREPGGEKSSAPAEGFPYAGHRHHRRIVDQDGEV